MATKKTAKKAAKPSKKAAQKPAKKAAKKPAKKPAKKAAKKTAKKAAKKAAPATKKKAAKKSPKKSTKQGGVTLQGTRHDPPVFLLVHLPQGLLPFERAERFEDPLELALGEHGAVSGGGTSLGEDGAPESCDIELEVSDVIRALPIIRRVLVDQGAPPGTLVTRLSRTGDFEVLVSIGS